MDALVNFCNNGRFIDCGPNEFNNIIKHTLMRLLLKKLSGENQYQVFFDSINRDYSDRILKCIICVRNMRDNSEFLVCNECCKICIDEDIIISILKDESRFEVVLCQFDGGYWVDTYEHFLCDNDNDKIILKMFIDNSHKLIHRFYHTVPITFLMSIFDPKSSCSILTWDIIIHIIKFIYWKLI